MKVLIKVCIVLVIVSLNACAILQEPIINRHDDIKKYKYVVIPKTDTITSGAGSVYGNQYGVYGGTITDSINPGSVIEGILLKKQFISVDEIRPEIANKTLIVKYGQSGKRDVAGGFGGYTLEVSISFINAKTYESVYSCTAEGQGSTEADDIREAITRCLSGIDWSNMDIAYIKVVNNYYTKSYKCF